ncbi:roadblock/LC7 domain-containing protein, partial [Streptomyces solincola]|uniref:roadblock/LC7 domain-containing protein n=2 Tax=Streptomyces TaxID=1883 RepID=UPI0021594137
MPGIDECLREAMSLPGARGAALVDWTSGLALGTAGDSPVGDHETTAAETAELARAAAEYESFAPGANGPPALPPGPSAGRSATRPVAAAPPA